MELTMERNPASLRRARKIALGSGTSLALAFASMQGAQAQSFNANSVSGLGGAVVTTASNTTIITVSQPQSVITWTPTDTGTTGTIDFQSSGTTAIYQDSPTASLTGYTVLNRILPVDVNGAAVSRPVAFNGSVTSTLGGNAGGDIWFYSPTGIVVNSKTAFNVGSLVLTTSDIDTTGGLFGAGGQIRFKGVTDPASSVTISGGANVLVGGTASSYLAIVSPRINQDGGIFAAGPVALVAAEAANISVNAGTFDINITQGSGDNLGISHTGSTSGPATTAAGQVQKIYMVAMPKNQIMTMLLSGSIGYQAASDVTVEGSSVILSSGYSHVGDRTTAAAGLGSLSIGDAAFNNSLFGDASGLLSIQPPGTGNTFFGADSFLHSDTRLDLTAGPASTISANTNLTLDAGTAMKGGTINVYAGRPADSGSTAGVITIGNTLFLNVNGGPGAAATPPVNGRAGIGGTINLQADFGKIQALSIEANANGTGEAGSGTGGDGFGGSINVTDTNNGLFLIANSVFLTANGQGGSSDGTAGSGSGGRVTIDDQAGVLAFGTVGLNAQGQGGFATASGARHGNGFGGQIDMTIRGNQTWNDLFANASAYGSSSTGGSTIAGSADADPNAILLKVTNAGQLEVSNGFLLQADGVAGINGGTNHAAGGGIVLQVDSGGSIFAFNGARIYARGLTDRETFTQNVNTSPDTFGGTIDIVLDNGALNVSTSSSPNPFPTTLDISAMAESSGAKVSAGFANGGSINITASNGGNFTSDDGGNAINGIVIQADALAGGGPSPSAAFGGFVQLTASDGTFSFGGTTNISASGRDGYFATRLAGTGFDATGGFAGVLVAPGTLGSGLMQFDQLNVLAVGLASGPSGGTATISGNGGTGTGGTAQVEVDGGTFKHGQLDVGSPPALFIDASGHGGNSGATASGNTRLVSGDGIGGIAQFIQTGGSSQISALNVVATGVGGSGSGFAFAGSDEIASNGGNGFGGNASVTVDGGVLSIADKIVGIPGDILIDASGLGGGGMDNNNTTSPNNAGDGGNGTGGVARLLMDPGSTGFLTANNLFVYGDGFGGNGGGGFTAQGGNGGKAIGGQAIAQIADGGFILTTGTLSALGTGGDGDANGGTGTGGLAQFAVIDTIAPADKSRSITDLSLDASGLGGGNSGGAQAASTAGKLALAADVPDPTSSLTITGNLTATALGANPPATGKGMTIHVSGADLTVSGAATLKTTGGIDFTSLGTAAFSAGTLDVQSAGQVTGTGLIRSLGATSVSGLLGINLTDLSSGAGTLLAAANGNILVSHDLASVGQVTANARGVNISSLGALDFADSAATAGNFAVATDGLLTTSGTIGATGTVKLKSNQNSVHVAGALSAPNVDLSALASGATIDIDLPQTITGAFTASADTAINLFGVLTAGSASLTSVADVNYNAISTTGDTTIHIDGGLSGSDINAGGKIVITANASPAFNFIDVGNLTANAGSISITKGNQIFAQNLTAGTWIEVNALDTIGIGSATGGTDVVLNSANVLSVQDVTAGDDIWLSLANPDGTIFAGNIVSTGLGSDSAAGPPVTFASYANSAGPAGRVTVVKSAGGLNIGNVQTPGRAVLTSTTTFGTGTVNAVQGIFAFVPADITLGGQLTTGGTLYIANPSMFASMSPAYDATSLAGLAPVRTGGSITFSAPVSAGDITIAAGTDLTGSTITGTGAVVLDAGGIVSATAVQSGGGKGISITGDLGIAAPTINSAGTTLLRSTGGTINVGTNLASAGAVTANGQAVTLVSTGALNFAQAQATAGNLNVTTAGNLTVANGGATGALALTSTGGSIGSTGTLQSGGNSAIIGSTGINLNTLQSGGTTLLRAVNGAINVTNLTSAGLVTVLGRSVTLASPGALSFASASATAGALQVTTGGNLLVASVDATGAVTLRSTGGSLRNTGTVGGSDVTLNGSTGLTLDGSVNATGALALQTGGTLAVNSLASGRTIAATSNDIAIASTGRLGTRGTTQTIALTNGAATGQTFVGGTGSAGLWSLSATEIGQLFADQRITVTAGGGGDMTVGSLAVSYGSGNPNGSGANLGSGGEFKLNASGKVTVNGALRFNTSGASDAFSIDPTRIDVVVDTGSIAMLGANGNEQGTLNLAAGTIAVGTASTIAAINAATGTLAIQQILDQPSTVPSQAGYLRAGQINFTVGSGLYIQNSGSTVAFADRRGFTANGVSITTGGASAASASSPTAIVVNGQIVSASGLALTGLATAPQVQINGTAAIAPGKFDPLSSINGCIIGASCSGGADDLAKSKPGIEGPLNPAGLNPKPVSAPLVTLAEPPTLEQTPLVDEPVTGVGNDDLWDGACNERQPCRGKDKPQ